MSKPAILSWGEGNIQCYDKEEFRASLRRAFIDGGASFIVLDSNPRGQRFLASCAAWGVREGLLYCDQIEDDGQSQVSSFRLTAKGKEEIR